MTTRAYRCSWYLIKRYGYIRDEDYPYRLYYTGCQRRSLREFIYAEKYKLEFKKYEESQSAAL